MTESWTARALATWDDGFHLPSLVLWLDPRRRVELGFASDAFGDARARRLIATPQTARFLRRRRSAPSFLPSPLGRSFQLGAADLRLVAAGTLPGAAQLELRVAGGTLLYFRRILPEPVGLGDALEAPRADTVLIDAPPAVAPQACSRRADTIVAIRAWVDRCLQRAEIPVLAAEPRAAAPALAAHLGRAGYELRLHPTIHDVVCLCAAGGIDFERAWRLREAPQVGQVVLIPATGRRARARSGADGERDGSAGAAALGSWTRVREAVQAAGSSAELRLALVHDGAAPPPPGLAPDEVFLLAFAAGVPDLVSHVQQTGAREALLSPDTPAVVGSVLRELGVAVATRLGPPEQLWL